VLVDLHSHLEGRVRPDTAEELARAARLTEPVGGWSAALQLDAPTDLTGYLVKVAASYPFFRRLEAIERLAREAVEDAAAVGYDYLELRFGPATHADAERSIADVIRAAAEGMRAASRATGMPSGLVVAALRHHDEELNLAVARSAASLAGDGVVGFDLAGDELLFPQLEPYRAAFALAASAGLGLTCHAAEAAGADAARQAVELLGATRIGHGAHMAEDPAVLAWAAGHGIVVEVCPTSNLYTGAIKAVAEHPAPIMRDAGVRLVLGDDNPMQTGADLAHERHVLAEVLGWTPEALAALDRDSIDAAFLSEGERHQLLGRLAAETGSA
jgi:adenosine deaminase